MPTLLDRAVVAVVALVGAGTTTGIALGAATSIAAPGVPAGAQAISDCSATSGVIVAVDFANWGGPIERGCAATPATGYDALHTAGFTTAGDEHDGAAFVCRIDTRPSPTQTSCVNTPPVSGHWSYWHADAGQTSWSYSSVGAVTYEPPPGSVTVWVFGDLGSPAFTPTQVRATNPAPGGGTETTTTATTTTATTTTESTTTATTTTATTTSPARTTAPTTAARTSSSSQHAGGGTSGAAGSEGARTKIVDVDPSSATMGPAAGSPIGLIVGAVVVGLVASAAGAIAWRRHRSSDLT